MAMFLALFLTTLQKNFLLVEEYLGGKNFNVKDYTNLGYSFYLVPCAAAMFLINIVLLVCSGYKFKCSFGDEAEKMGSTDMILY